MRVVHVLPSLVAVGCGGSDAPGDAAAPDDAPAVFLSDPLVSHIYTADPSAHVFDGRLYVYPSHDVATGVPDDGNGSVFDMRDYHVLSLGRVGEPVTDHGVALDLATIPWATRQLWAPDAAHKAGMYYLYFPARDAQDIFRIGVAVASQPAGPFVAQPAPIARSFSIDPAVFEDRDGAHYMYFGGIAAGQLQRWTTGTYSATDVYPAADQPALAPKVARLAGDMVSFAEEPRDVVVLDEQGAPIRAGDERRRFFEASWMHEHRGTYYFSYSTGSTHYIVYATGSSPYGPFTYRGRILEPVLGWTNHHSVVEHDGKSYLFYHDAQLSNGVDYLRNIKVTELAYYSDGRIVTVDAYRPPL